MPTVHITETTALADGRHYTAGTTVDMNVDQMKEATRGGWAELLRGSAMETPEQARTRRQGRPERA